MIGAACVLLKCYGTILCIHAKDNRRVDRGDAFLLLGCRMRDQQYALCPDYTSPFIHFFQVPVWVYRQQVYLSVSSGPSHMGSILNGLKGTLSIYFKVSFVLSSLLFPSRNYYYLQGYPCLSVAGLYDCSSLFSIRFEMGLALCCRTHHNGCHRVINY